MQTMKTHLKKLKINVFIQSAKSFSTYFFLFLIVSFFLNFPLISENYFCFSKCFIFFGIVVCFLENPFVVVNFDVF